MTGSVMPAYKPLRIHASRWFSAAARSATTASPGPGCGIGSLFEEEPLGSSRSRSTMALHDG